MINRRQNSVAYLEIMNPDINPSYIPFDTTAYSHQMLFKMLLRTHAN